MGYLFMALGIGGLVLAYVLGVKHNLKILQNYHYAKVKKSDLPLYARGMGLAIAVLGVSFIVYGIIVTFYKPEGYLPYAVIIIGVLASFLLVQKTQSKYNR